MPFIDYPLPWDYSNYSFFENGFLRNLWRRYQSVRGRGDAIPLYTEEDLRKAFTGGDAVLTDHHLRVARALVRAAQTLLFANAAKLDAGQTKAELKALATDPVFVEEGIGIGLLVDLQELLESAQSDVADRLEGRAKRNTAGPIAWLPAAILLVEESTSKVVIGRVIFELIAGGSGKLHPTLPMLFVQRDEEWKSAEAAARQAVTAIWPESSSYDVRYRLESDPSVETLEVLRDRSAGALLALAVACLFDKEQGPASGRNLLREAAITGGIDADGNLFVTGTEEQKIEAALSLPHTEAHVPVIRKIVVAANYVRPEAPARLAHLGIQSAEWGYRFERDPLVVLRATNLAEAMEMLRSHYYYSWFHDFISPRQPEGLLLTIYREYVGLVPGRRGAQPRAENRWLEDQEHGRSFLVKAWEPSEDQLSRAFALLFPTVAEGLLSAKRDEPHPIRQERAFERLMADHLIRTLRHPSASQGTWIAEKEIEVSRDVTLLLTLHRNTMGQQLNVSHGLLIPSPFSAHLQKNQKLIDKLADLELKLPTGKYYVWTAIFQNPVMHRDEWVLGDTIADALSELIPIVPVLEKARDDSEGATVLVNALKQTYGDFKWAVTAPVSDYYDKYGRPEVLSEEEALDSKSKPTDELMKKVKRIFTEQNEVGWGIHAGFRGSGGMGKTQLARHVAHQFLRDWAAKPSECLFPDGVIEINLRAHNYGLTEKGTDRLPHLTAEEAYAEILEKLKIPAETLEAARHKDGGSLRPYLEQWIAEHRILLILDNAASITQVETLLPKVGGGSRAIITAREKLGHKTLEEERLLPWGPRDTFRYLVSRGVIDLSDRGAVNYPETSRKAEILAGKLHDLAGGQPLAVQIAASYASRIISRGRRAMLEDVVECLEHAEGEDPLKSILDFCIDLDAEEEARRCFESLCVFPDRFDAAAAAFVWEQELANAQALLEDFELKGFVTRQSDFKFCGSEMPEWIATYRMHDLIRQHAAERLKRRKDWREQWKRDEWRFIVHYTGRQCVQNELLLHTDSEFRSLLGERHTLAAFNLFNSDESNYTSAFLRLKGLEQAGERKRLYSLMAGSATRVWDLLLPANVREDRIAMAIKAQAQDPSAMRDREEAIIHLISHGLAYRHQGKRLLAEAEFRKALKAALAIKWRPGLSAACGNLGNIQQEHATDEANPKKKEAYLERALRCHLRAEKFSVFCRDEISLAIDWGNQAIVYMNLWDRQLKNQAHYERSAELYTKRIDKACSEAIRDDRGAGNGWGNKASLILDRARIESDPEERVKLIDNALEAYAKAKDCHWNGRNPRGEAASLCNLGRAHRISADLDPARRDHHHRKARTAILESLSIFEKIGDALGRRVALGNLLALNTAEDLLSEEIREKLFQLEKSLKLKAPQKQWLCNVAGKEEVAGLRALADKYGKLACISISRMEAENSTVTRAVVSAHGLYRALIRQALLRPTQH